MNEQRERARAASHFTSDLDASSLSASVLSELLDEQEFSGYDEQTSSGQVVGLFIEGQPAPTVRQGDQCIIVLDKTPFYGESGGQVGDTGLISLGAAAQVNVVDAKKQVGLTLHYGEVADGALHLGDSVQASVDEKSRQAIRLNHSATHLLHAALRQVLGDHVEQKGSLVDAERLRFDFSHADAVNGDELLKIERLVTDQMRAPDAVAVAVMPYADAMDSGAMALFGEKYSDVVRVLRMGTFSVELCGGTHANRTGDIGLFKLIAESGIASGVRRVEAVTGVRAVDYVQQSESSFKDIANLLKTSPDQATKKIEQLADRVKGQEKEILALKQQLAGQSSGDISENAVSVGDIKVVSQAIKGADVAALRGTMDKLKDRLPQSVIVLATVEDSKVRLIAGVTKNLTKRMAAGELVNFVAQQVDGKGGGRPDMAQAGGNDPSKLDEALASVVDWVTERSSLE